MLNNWSLSGYSKLWQPPLPKGTYDLILNLWLLQHPPWLFALTTDCRDTAAPLFFIPQSCLVWSPQALGLLPTCLSFVKHLTFEDLWTSCWWKMTGHMSQNHMSSSQKWPQFSACPQFLAVTPKWWPLLQDCCSSQEWAAPFCFTNTAFPMLQKAVEI